MAEPVASEPRLFVGQVPTMCREEDLFTLFTPFGTVRNLHLLKGADGKPRGCAMVLYARWSQAEAAADHLDGVSLPQGGGAVGRPLVVHFANPRRAPPGQPAEPGVAPRKLFVGQVPRDVSEDALRPFFEPYGEIEHINILRTHRGQSCAFVQFRKWCQAEAAMEAHNGKTRMGTSEVPLVVKFADAKRKDTGAGQMGVGWGGNGMLRNGLGPGMGMANGLAGLGGGLAGLSLNEQYGIANGMVGDNQALLNSMGLNSLGAGAPSGYLLPGMQDPSAIAAANPLLANSIATSLANGTLDSTALSAGLAVTPPGGLSGLSINAQMPPGGPGNGMPGAGPGYGGGGEGISNGGCAPGGGGGPMNPNPNRAQAEAQALQNLSKLSAAGRAAGAPGPGGAGGYLPTGARLWGQKIGSNDKFNEWKLFIGQVPLEATEEELYSLFAPIGEILELYILRNSNGKSRGCAFVTYANKFLAQQAITQLNGKQVPPGKTLVVKFADRAIASKAAATAAANYSSAGPANGSFYM
ncbi:hypothetical protein WJX81_005523 [Elliptochloris bilobata]|uniref:RRM domain-containing protein n=1 Tax=Elliptochloris bilobata TaxID=381761 RepID=A0AAW1QL04_9CHLO